MNACEGCGTPSAPEDPTPAHCPSCPPEPCDECGGVNVWSTGEMCACWVSLEGMSLADIKAVFADECLDPFCTEHVSLSIDPIIDGGAS